MRKLVTVVVVCVVASGSVAAAAAAPKAPRRLAPDLQPLVPETVEGPATTFDIPLGVDAPVRIDGCYLDERIRKGAQRCLRFDGIVANIGRGPLELAYGPDIGGTSFKAMQRVFYSDGTFRDRFATYSEPHPTHLHFHVQDFYVARLWKSSAAGGRFGTTPVANGDKNGFCPEDSAPVEGAEAGGSTYSCFTEGERSEPAPVQVVGISAGWKDIYRYSLPDQYVEISGVPDGFYALEIELDPNNVFLEANETNNTVCVVLRLEGTSASLLGPSITC